jgi:hypothetical protein
MDNLNLGQIITTTQNRDAIHVAIAPVVAFEELDPGQHVGFIGDRIGPCKNLIGIVDPYLKDSVLAGQKFWLFLYPNTVTSLRHQWEHPAFDAKLTMSPAELRLREEAERLDRISYEKLMYAAAYYLETGEYLCEGGRFEGMGVSDTFWDDYQTVTGVKLPEDKYRGSFFSCSC